MRKQKSSNLLLPILCLFIVLMLAACGSDEGEACGDGEQNNEETGIDCGGPICDPCPTCSDEILNGDETGIDCGGTFCEICPTCVDGIINGDETEVDCGGSDCPICLHGVEGKWFSSGSDLSLILSNIEDVDSAVLDFEPGGLYSIVYYKASGAENKVGTFNQTASGVVDIWYVNANQITPTVASFSGIIQNPSDDRDQLFYELVLLDGENSPPTAEAGLGSSNEGELGNANISLFHRRTIE